MNKLIDVIIAVDIGLSGGIAFFDCSEFNHAGKGLLSIHKMPTQKIVTKSGKDKNVVDLDKLKFLLEIPKEHTESALLVMEDVHAFPGQGVVSSASLLEQKGILKGMATAFGYDILLVSPKEWQKSFGIVAPKDLRGSTAAKTKTIRKKWLKERSLETSKSLFPEWEEKIGSLDGLSDSVLIGAWTMNLDS